VKIKVEKWTAAICEILLYSQQHIRPHTMHCSRALHKHLMCEISYLLLFTYLTVVHLLCMLLDIPHKHSRCIYYFLLLECNPCIATAATLFMDLLKRSRIIRDFPGTVSIELFSDHSNPSKLPPTALRLPVCNLLPLPFRFSPAFLYFSNFSQKKKLATHFLQHFFFHFYCHFLYYCALSPTIYLLFPLCCVCLGT
jgi:hypothetical protein